MSLNGNSVPDNRARRLGSTSPEPISVPSHSDAFKVLVLQAADGGRGPVLFGDSLERAYREASAFMIGEKFPSVYLDTKNPLPPLAAVHFQPRSRTELVSPFCEALGRPGLAALYLNQAGRMPAGWGLDFFGVFRGRRDAPLRACGYLDRAEVHRCGEDPRHLARRFDRIGFRAYDDIMLDRLSQLMARARKPSTSRST